MVEREDRSAAASAEMMAHLGRLAHGDGFVCGLTAAQWTALRFFARANRFSRTVSAFADYHATTRGTASQTVKSLVARGYLARTRSQTDRRSVRIDLTARGRALLRHDPFEDLVTAVSELPQGLQRNLSSALERITGRIVCDRRNRPFGTCQLCSHLSRRICEGDQMAGLFCRFENEPLEETELEEICVNYEPAAGSKTKGDVARA